MLKKYVNTKLIVIDSITYHFRVNVSVKNARDNILDFIGLSLFRIAKENNLAVVVSNHVTQEENSSTWIPSLGHSWGNWCSSRLFLYRKRNVRFAYLYKSYDPTESKPVTFCIKSCGITDPVEDELEEPFKNEEIINKLDEDINMSFTQLKKEKDDEDEQEKVDMFWKGVYSNRNRIMGGYNCSPESSQQTEGYTQTREPLNEEDDLPTYTQTEFKQVPEEETSIQNIETIREEEEGEEEVDLFSEPSIKEEDNIYEVDDFSSQLPMDEDDGSNFLSEPHTNNGSRNDPNLLYPVSNQIIYAEDDFIPATQVAEMPNLTRETQSSNGDLAYQSQEENTMSFFKEIDDTELPFYSQDSDTPSLRASLGIEMSSTGVEYTSSLTDVRSRFSSIEKSSTPKGIADDFLLSDEKETEDDSLLIGFEDFKQEVMPESEMSIPSCTDLPIPLLPTEENQHTTSTLQPNQAEEFDLRLVTKTIPEKEENEESIPHSSQVNSVEKHDLIVNEEAGKEIIQDCQIPTTESSLSSEEKNINQDVMQPVSSTKKRDCDTTDYIEDVDNLPKRKKINESPISNDAESNHDTIEGIKNVDQTQQDNITNQTRKDTAMINTVSMKDKEIIADWDSDVEEELDYKYINEMNDFF
ncbi:hypothetical protein BDF21DRAFT_134745 [Thamnidium elegans]|nr:hypothetical protein BDF21DRAFT_134745 [Thamnidium elegans]